VKRTLYHFSRIFLLTVIILSCLSSEAQRRGRGAVERQGNARTARDLFEMHNFKEALDEYLLLYQKDSLNHIYNYRIGVCYLNTNIDKSKAIKYLEYAVKSPNIEPDAWYELGRSYQYVYKFEDAITAYRNYMKLHTARQEKFYIPAHRQIQMCRDAMELMKTPINISFYNMGSHINSPFPDFNPYVPADESFMVFTSKRDNNTGRLMDFDGYYTSDVYISTRREDVWSRVKSLGSIINTDLVEETAGISSDGQTLFFYIDNYHGFNDIMWSQRKGRSFQRASYIGSGINSNKLETAATISPDNETIIFASERDGGYGGTDLYISRKMPNGDWSPATNLGFVINTPYNEDFPMFSHDGKTLYFASQGHQNMGGYDLFKSDWDEKNQQWSKPVNLGYPLNTPEDNMTISFSASGRHAYVSALRPEGYGDLDIYRVVFNDIAPPLVVVSGNLLKADSTSFFSDNMFDGFGSMFSSSVDNKNTELHIRVYDKLTGRLFGRYMPNKNTGRYVVILPPGEYSMSFIGNQLLTHTEDIIIPNIELSNNHIKKNIVLIPKNDALKAD